MKIFSLQLLGITLVISHNALGQEWKNECVGYYQMQLPDNLEAGLYPIEGFIKPDRQPETNGFFITGRYANNGITFGGKFDTATIDTVQAQFTSFYYGDYELDISSESETQVNFTKYKNMIVDNITFGSEVDRKYQERDLKLLNKPMDEKSEFLRKHKHILKDYPSAFVDYDYRGYTIYINRGKHLYHFWGKNQKSTGEKSQTAEAQIKKSEPEVLSLLKRFRPRELYEVPPEPGFCIPYGFIAGDSGHEPRNMGVTYRLKNHPDITIFFQDLGPNPGPGERRPDPNMSAKDYVTYFWNRRYGHSFRKIKLYGKEFTYPEIDNRKAVAAFAKFTRFSKEIDYGYVAFVKGTIPDEPDLLFYVMRDSRQAKGNPPMDKDQLKKMAEQIVSSIKRR
ncbi:T6SS immunity protein Tli4 family protein [Leclercia adecarboxylata]|uniref:Tle cognate immunity protein 4 C-terminal domain-containing protein n=1 Tax=Leclercia adecarboxylata TaxID=83655 RepID=A0AAP9DAK5_9ENTR|nr:T6SS immunity protein Tli4 family protein [Leclercia adecarboxylata]QDK18301.1 hypothetical protein ES815_08285 [Leclercia adecarboxylata]